METEAQNGGDDRDDQQDLLSDRGESYQRTREKFRQQLHEGKLDERMVEIEVRERNFPSFEIITNTGVEEMGVNIRDMLPGLFGQKTKKRKVRVTEADILRDGFGAKPRFEQEGVISDCFKKILIKPISNNGDILIYLISPAL